MRKPRKQTLTMTKIGAESFRMSMEASMPDTLRDIEFWIERNNVRGTRGSGKTCPLAHMLSESFGADVYVSGSFASLPDGTTASLPQAAAEYRWRFDHGKYPHHEGS